ncbi:MAG TPA: hypothetical protein VG225_07410 [Terracidiphilus sp.]|jgi:hypothetical protein|nr:hypothetical protein [Terracidiphilus sp.]
METNIKMCAGMETKLADMLLDPETVPATVKTHVAECDGCRRELEELRATMAMMDAWKAPEPNPYFVTRFQARLREEKQAKPASWLERIRARIMMAPQMHTRPLAAMALTVLLLLGGGTYLDFYWQAPPAVPPQTAVVHDLQTLDNNAQLLDQLESISGDENSANE